MDFPLKFKHLKWSGQEDLNLRPLRPGMAGNARKSLIFKLLKINGLCWDLLGFIKFLGSLGVWTATKSSTGDRT
jgi:hypothetical protein